ncbi:MAG TPA: hypothetical protein VGF67_06580 [Ktedonobacteraceae bacterium]|jgi:hypothetical protein
MFPSDDGTRQNAEARAQEGRQRYHQHRTAKSRLHEQEAWMRWQYSPEEWALFERVDWRPIRLLFWGLAGGCAASVLAAILPWFLFPSGEAGTPLLLAVYLPAILVWCVLVPLTARYFFLYLDARNRHIARRQEPRTVTFSGEGIWEAGTFFPVEKFLSANLKKVTLTFDPPVLHLRLTRWPRGKNWRSSSTTTTLHVPVPHGQEEEAGFLQERLQTEVIQARAQLETRRNNPPEPR